MGGVTAQQQPIKINGKVVRFEAGIDKSMLWEKKHSTGVVQQILAKLLCAYTAGYDTPLSRPHT